MKRDLKIYLLMFAVGAVFLWWMLGAYTTHGKAFYRPVRPEDSLAKLIAPASRP